MRIKAKKTLSLLLVFCMIVSLFAGLTVTASAASQTVTVEITDKAGETKTLATWEYDSTGLTYKDTATGKELAIVRDYSAAPLVYTGINKKPDPRCLSVTVKGIPLEDLYEYASELADGIDLRGDTAMYIADASGYKDEFTYDQYWGLTRYNYMSWYSAETYAAASEENCTDGVEVPTTLAIVGYHSALFSDGVKTAAELAASADALNALRISVGMQESGKTEIADSWVYEGNNGGAGDVNEGNLSVKGISVIRFTPVYHDFTVTAEHATVTTADGYTKAAAGETVAFTVAAEDGYEVKTVSVKQGETTLRHTEESGTYSFTMPEAVEGSTVAITVETEASAPSVWNGSTIGSAADFEAFAAAVNGGDDFAGNTVTLSGNVDLSTVADWTPVGDKDHPFAGTFDGAGKAITGLTITDITGGYHGLFGYVTGTVKDFTLAGSISGTGMVDFVGSVAGFNAGTITGVTSSVVINATSAYNVGGIAGLNTSGLWVNSSDAAVEIAGATGLIENCANTGAVTGMQKVGGIVGENAGTVNACYNTGKVDGTNASSKNGVGGIAGRNGNNNTAKEVGIISNCYNTGAVGRSGQKWTGGIAGFNNSLSSIKNCYNTGEIVDTTGRNNPIAGNQESSKAVNNYSLEGLRYTGSSEAERGVVKTAEEMKAAEFVTALCGDGRAFVAKTDDYPILRWQAGPDTAAVTGLTVEAPPTKLTYVKGETFDPSGLKIVKKWSDGTTETLYDYTVSKTDAITENCTVTISASYGEFSVSQNYSVTVITVTGIEISGNPTTEYVEGQSFRTSGMVVEAIYSDNSRRTLRLSDYTVEPSGALTLANTKVTVSYTPTEGGTAFTADLPITVTERVLQSIEVYDEPDDLYYAADEALDLTGMEIRATFNDSTYFGDVIDLKTDENPDGYTWALGTDNKTVTITYTFKNVTKTATFEITRSTGNTPALTDGAYQLSSTDDLVWFGKKVNDAGKTGLNATLIADISVPDDWEALYAFKGVFDGNGHKLTFSMTQAQEFSGFFNALAGTVKNLTMDGTVIAAITTGWSKQNVGVFANTTSKGAVFENCVNLASLTVNAEEGQDTVSNVGAFVGRTSSGGAKLSGCVNKGSISGNIKNAGGIVGQIYFSGVEILNCGNTGSISSTAADGTGFGGIVGNVDDTSIISGCYNAGSIRGANGAGGIVGTGLKFTLTNCYNTGAVTAASADSANGAGGIVGTTTGTATLENCYNVGSITAAEGVSANLGALVGLVTKTGASVTNAYYPEGGTAYNTADGVAVTTEKTEGKTDADMKSADFAALLGSAFAADSTNLNGGYAILTWQVPSTPVQPDPDPDPTPGGDVTAAVWDGRSIDLTWYDPAATELYISTPAQLAGLAAIVNGIYNEEIDTFAGDKSYIVDNRADSGSTGGNNMATSAYHYGADNFAGKTVYLTADIDMGTANFMPIGGQYLMKKNDSTTRIDASFCGVFDGQGHSVTFHTDRHCSSGNYGDGQSVGLIGRLGVHDNESDTAPTTDMGVRNVAVYGSVYANRSVGGVVGKIGRHGGSAVIENCANFATVTGTDSKGTGGICGAAWNGGVIRNCYNAGAIKTTYNSGMTGGIAGSSESQIINCYNVGTITGPAGNTTSAIASDNGGSSFENCYWLSGSAGAGVYGKTLDSVVEKTAEELKSAGMPALLGSAFTADSGSINSGYPILTWQASDSPDPGTTDQPGGKTETELPFTDVADHWALDAIRYAYENKLFQGVSETEFAPNAAMTRGMLVTVLYRLAGEPETAADAAFSDVAADTWYAKAVAWAAENEIVMGYGATFGPNDLVTREQMAAILFRYAAWKQYDTTAGGMALREYADYAEISDWAAAALDWANAEGLILGRTETTIVPQGDATRAEVATILMRFIEKYTQK